MKKKFRNSSTNSEEVLLLIFSPKTKQKRQFFDMPYSFKSEKPKLYFGTKLEK